MKTCMFCYFLILKMFFLFSGTHFRTPWALATSSGPPGVPGPQVEKPWTVRTKGQTTVAIIFNEKSAHAAFTVIIAGEERPLGQRFPKSMRSRNLIRWRPTMLICSVREKCAGRGIPSQRIKIPP